MIAKHFILFALLLFSFKINAQEKDHPISYYAGTGMGGQDFLHGKHHYVGIDQSVWRFVYASTQLGFMHATNKKYFNVEDVSLDEHSYNLMMQFDANIRIKLGPITIIPHAGLIGRYSDEIRYLHGSQHFPDQAVQEHKSYRKKAFSGLSYGKAIGLNLEFMIFEHTSFGVRTDIHEYNNSPTSLSTVTFQIRTNFPKLISDLKKPIP